MRRLLLLVAVCSLSMPVPFSWAATSKSKGRPKPAAKSKTAPKAQPDVIQPEAKALLESAAKKYDDATSMHMEMKMEMKVQMKGMPAPPMPAMSMTMDTQKPNRSRSVITGLAGPGGDAKANIVVRDGETAWTYMGMLNQYTETKASSTGEAPQAGLFGIGDPAMGGADWRTFLNPRALRHAALAKSPEMVGENSCRVIETRISLADLTPKAGKLPDSAAKAMSSMMKRPTKMNFSIDNEGIIRKIEMDLTDMMKEMMKSAPAAGGPVVEKMTSTMLYSKVEFNPSMPEDIFKFTPPDGAKLVKEFDFAAVLGGKSEEASLEGKPAPDFTLKSSDGKTVKLSDLKGKPVFINFYGEF